MFKKLTKLLLLPKLRLWFDTQACQAWYTSKAINRLDHPSLSPWNLELCLFLYRLCPLLLYSTFLFFLFYIFRMFLGISLWAMVCIHQPIKALVWDYKNIATTLLITIHTHTQQRGWSVRFVEFTQILALQHFPAGLCWSVSVCIYAFERNCYETFRKWCFYLWVTTLFLVRRSISSFSTLLSMTQFSAVYVICRAHYYQRYHYYIKEGSSRIKMLSAASVTDWVYFGCKNNFSVFAL